MAQERPTEKSRKDPKNRAIPTRVHRSPKEYRRSENNKIIQDTLDNVQYVPVLGVFEDYEPF